MMKNGLIPLYFEYHTDVKYDNNGYRFIKNGKGTYFIKTLDGRLIESDKWLELAEAYISQNKLDGLYKQIKEYISANRKWVKPNEVSLYSAKCLLRESYKAWKDFNYQERLKL